MVREKWNRKMKASTTIEAAIIVPLFMMMLVLLVLSAIKCHDRAIYNTIAVKGNVQAEFGARKKEDYERNIEQIGGKINAYLDEKVIYNKQRLCLKNNVMNISSEASLIGKNDPVEFTWLTDAAKNLMKGA